MCFFLFTDANFFTCKKNWCLKGKVLKAVILLRKKSEFYENTFNLIVECFFKQSIVYNFYIILYEIYVFIPSFIL